MVNAELISSVIIFAFLSAGFASFGLAWVSWKWVDHPISNIFGALQLCAAIWAVIAVVGFISPVDELSISTLAVLTPFESLCGVLWFLFVIEYTDNRDLIPTGVDKFLFAEVAVVSVIRLVNPFDLAYTNQAVDTYGLINVPYIEYGIVTQVQIIFVFTLILCSFGMLGRFFLQTRNMYRKQTGVIFTVTFIIATANALYYSGYVVFPNLDITPVLFIVQAIGVSYALYEYDFLSVAPLATHTLFEEMSEPVFIIDEESAVVDHNKAAAEFFDGEDEMVLAENLVPDIKSLMEDDPEEGENKTTQIVIEREVEGRVVSSIYTVRMTPISDRYGIVRGYALVFNDITELQKQKQELERQNTRLEEFTGIVSHDLRTPLQTMDGYVEMAESTGDVSYLGEARESVERMEMMIESLLELARNGQSIDDPESVNLAASAKEAWEGFETSSATLEVTVDRDVAADPERLRQVFENLFRNAVEYGGEDVSVTVKPTAQGFAISDDGPGISEDKRDTIFDFGVTYSEDGTGFGLSIVEDIVKAHGWTIEFCESEIGGACFEITTDVDVAL